MPTFGADISALLAHAGLTDADDFARLAETMSQHCPTRVHQVTGWAHGKPIQYGPQVRALLAALEVPRQRIFDHIAPVLLLPALWCPTLGDKLTELRTTAGLTRDQLAAAAGVNAGTLARWEQAHTQPQPAALAAVCDALQVTAAQLLAYGDWPPSHLPVGDRPAFAQWLGGQMTHLELSESELSRRLGVTQPTVNAWMRGRNYPRPDTWTALAERLTVLGAPITVDQLWALQLPERVSDADLGQLSPLARLLATSRMGLRLCQEVAADRAGVPAAAYRRWERGHAAPRIPQLPALAAALNISVDDLAEALRETAGETRRDVGASIRFHRQALGLLNRQLARQLGVHRNTVHAWEQGYLTVPEALFGDIAEALQVTVDTVHDWAGEPAPTRVALGAQLRDQRLARGLTQKQVADLVGISQRLVSTIESGAAPAPARMQALLAADRHLAAV